MGQLGSRAHAGSLTSYGQGCVSGMQNIEKRPGALHPLALTATGDKRAEIWQKLSGREKGQLKACVNLKIRQPTFDRGRR